MSGYIIRVGHEEPQKVIVAQPNKQGNPAVDVAEMYKTVGAYILPNRARVWGRRVLDNGKLAKENGQDSVVEVTNREYHGKIEFLPWGDTSLGAHAIEIRYLKQSLSLDYEFQNAVQKVSVDPEGKDGSAHIELHAGDNEFDPKTDALFIQMLKVYPQNRDSKSKNPDPMIKGFTYFEVTDSHVDRRVIDNIESKTDAGVMVKGLAGDYEALRNLMQTFINYNVVFTEKDLLKNDLDIYKSLLVMADARPRDFNDVVARFKREVSDAFVKAQTFKLIDLTLAGKIGLVIKGKKQEVIDDIDAQGEQMIDWVLDNLYKKNVFDGVGKILIEAEQATK